MEIQWILLLTVLQFVFSLDDASDKSENAIDSIEDSSIPSWMFKCEPETGCYRVTKPLSATVNTTNTFENVDLCRTVCGRFGGLWPRPVTAAISAQTVKIHPNYLRFDLIDTPSETRNMLVEMTGLLTNNMAAECGGNVTELADTPVIVYLSVKSADLSLGWHTSEQYVLDVQSKGGDISVHLVAETVYGARHGLETLSQLVSSTKPDYAEVSTCGLRMVAGAKIKDRPVYPHRGFMLDSSRNFVPLADIKRMIDGMATTKLNVFHWHVTDSHSFPLESPRVPQLSKYGAYSSSQIYTAEEVRELVHYAKVRGVRLVIEIDAPAHAGNGWQWGKEYGYGDLAVCVNAQPWRSYCIEPPCGQLNPANPDMYRVLKDLYRDIAELLPKPQLFHMGGDEVFIRCWNSSNEIVSYMKGKGFNRSQEGFLRLWAEFHASTLRMWDEVLEEMGEKSGEPVILWSSELTQAGGIQRYLDKQRYVIAVWEPAESPLLKQLLQLGYRTIAIPKNRWYLDHGFWGHTTYSNWRKMYAYTLPRDQGLLGGEVAMWSEYVDEQALDGRVWPRAAAVAERLWANPSSMAGAAESRFQRLRNRLVARGLRPDVLSPGWCAQNDMRCV